MRFVVTGKITPAARMTQKSKYVSKAAQDYLAYKDQIGYRAKEMQCPIITKPTPVSLTVYAYAHDRKWDISNVLKAVEDALNNICWDDDKQIMAINILALETEASPERLEISYHPFGEWNWGNE